LGIVLLLHSIAPIVRNKWSWAIITVLIMLIMTSGFMYTLIRGVPYAGPDGAWIAAGSQNQVGQEVHVISFICASQLPTSYLLFIAFIDGLLSFSLLMLILVVPHQSSPQKQRLQIVLWTGITMVMYSVLVALFRIKNRGWLPLVFTNFIQVVNFPSRQDIPSNSFYNVVFKERCIKYSRIHS
jgi:oligosaccharyltransferase complex subunit gamma